MAKVSSVSELVLRWQELRDQGRTIAAEALCADCPELLDELRRQVHALLSMEQFLGTEPTERPKQVAEDQHQAATPPPVSGQKTVSDGPGQPTPLGPAWAGLGRRYLPLHLHARGGLGEVFVALDEELNREIALKRMQPRRQADTNSRRRFLAEAEITARLEHPGVVPVHGLGEDAEGQPCYAMRFIRGETLQDAIRKYHEPGTPGRDAAERSLAQRQLLTRFVAVCNTVAYAHSRRIVHRDLKPANIMLGNYGETLVVDWGLAKRFERTEAERSTDEDTLEPKTPMAEPTQSGEVMGTPAYMSPEQANGHWDQVGPASDIYSLGATLYAILTGQGPFHGAQELDAVRRGAVRPPRQVKKDVPRALEAICLKAMALRPADRYTTALDLSADVEKWLADEPVRAWREPWTARARRWINRQRVLMTGATVAVLVAMLGLAVAAVVLRAMNEQLASATHELESANASLTVTNQQLTEAQKQAEDNAREARAAIDQYYVRASQETLLRHPQFLPLRKSLLETAVAYYKSLLPKLRSDPQLRQELAKTCRLVGRITWSVGSHEDALPYFREACDLSAQLMQENPRDTSLKAEWARALAHLAQTLKLLKKISEARPVFLRSIEIWEQLAELDPARYAHELAYEYDDMNIFPNEECRDPKGAWIYLRKGLAIMEPLVEKHPESEEYIRGLAYFYNNRGELYAADGNLDSALKEHKKALAIREKLVRDYPKDTKYGHRYYLARSFTRVAEDEQKLGAADQAAQYFLAARDQLTRLVDEAPANLIYREDLAKCCQQHGRLLLDGKRWLDAFTVLKTAGDNWEKVADAGPRGTDARLDGARARASAGRALAELGRGPEAEMEWQRAGGQLREAVKNGFKDVGSLKQDPDLKPLQERDDFKRLCAELEPKGKKGGEE
jgi:serine/threonine-protein kinase